MKLKLRRTRKGKRIKPIFKALIYMCIFILYFNFLESRVSLLPESYLSQVAQKYAEEVVNDVIIDEFIDIESLYYINESMDYIESDALEISLIKADLSGKINDELTGNDWCFIPVGSLLEYRMLNGYGFSVPINFYFVGSASVDFEIELISSGINQVVYLVSISVNAEIVPISLTEDSTYSFVIEYPLSLIYIEGGVPTYAKLY